MTHKIKHPQFIVATLNSHCVESGLQDGYNPSDDIAVQAFNDNLLDALIIARRNRLDGKPNYVQGQGFEFDYSGDRDFRQLLPYTVLVCNVDCQDYLLTYQRGQGVGESRLAGNASVGFGGHVDLADVVSNDKSEINIQATLRDAALRELTEELRFVGQDANFIRDSAREYPGGILFDNSNDVGKLHVGLVAFYCLPAALNPLSLQVECAEEELTMIGWKTPEELLATDLNAESWTRLIAEGLVARRHHVQ